MDNDFSAVWERFIRTGEIGSQVRPSIAASWKRCRDKGVDPYGKKPIRCATSSNLEKILQGSQTLIEAARPFMQDLYKLVESSGFVVVLADHEGYLIEVIGDVDVLESNRGVYYSRGVRWTEELVGTTAITLAQQEMQPIQVAGCEHYCQKHHGWACSAAPVQDGNGRFVGVLNVTGPREHVHCHTLGMVVSAAAAITNILHVQHAQEELNESARINSTIVNSISDGLLMLDGKGIVTHINPVGARILHTSVNEAVGKHISAIVEFKPIVLEVLKTGQGYTDKEYFIETKRGTMHFVKTAIPLKDKDGRLEGVIDIFREIKRVRKLVNHMVGATAQYHFDDLIGASSAIKETIRLGKIAANSMATVLIQGESGTGKELVAQAIHNASLRHEGPFVAINCGAIPRNLIETELFGYEEGSFTGAKNGGRPGKFELANGGTIFLDEIGEMPLDMQVRLLRVIQEKRITRVGGQHCFDIDVRVIAATNRDLARAVREGNFRQDLFYRLNVLPIHVPPLRERAGDIQMLAQEFLTKICQQMGGGLKQITPEALSVLQNYEWPGNVRELENVIERAVNICEEPEISTDYLPHALLDRPLKAMQGDISLKDMERRMIEEAVAKTGGNISNAARLLGIGRNTLYCKLKEYQIPPIRL